MDAGSSKGMDAGGRRSEKSDDFLHAFHSIEQ